MAAHSDAVPIMASVMQDRLLVAAIDFGTTYSGYAFSYMTDFTRDPLDIKGYLWRRDDGIVAQHKTPSCILFDKDQKFDSFGFEAEKKYDEICLKGKEKEWYFFKRFKMELYEKVQEMSTREEASHEVYRRGRRTYNIQRDMMLSENKVNPHYGKEMKAMDVFSAAIQFLKDHMLDNNKDITNEEAPIPLKIDEIHWVLTVPAIWNDAAKQFMREAAIKAGISEVNLSIALEPEAASLYCKYLPTVRGTRQDGSTGIFAFEPGTKYVILDAGGGTVDITAHEVLSDQTLRELHAANGGDWGGVKVDEAFNNFLDEFAGADVMEVFRNNHRDEYNELMERFEIKKRTIKPEDDTKVNITLPSSLLSTYKELKNGSKMEDINRGSHRARVSVINSKLRFDHGIVKGFFQETCNKIAVHLEDLLNHGSVKDIDTILMVGGFSESAILQDVIKKAFGTNRNIIIPQDAGSAVLKGAVVYGHLPGTIVSRVCQYTYGIEVWDAFEPALDPQSKIIDVNGRRLCKNRFNKHAEIGQEFHMGEALGPQEYLTTVPDKDEVAVSVYRSKKRNPRHVDEDDCQKIGTMQFRLKRTEREQKSFSVKIVFGGPELRINVVETGSVEITEEKLEFLDRQI